jgi:hypothetical protein
MSGVSSSMGYTVRVDDVSVNTDLTALRKRLDILREHFGSNLWIILAISPCVFDMQSTNNVNDAYEPERIFPRLLRAHSDHRELYKVNQCGLPDLRDLGQHTRAAHGLVHVDHRLLNYETQELSILGSCALADSKLFVPPFNYWNKDTAAVCREHNIQLIRFEDGWRSMEHTDYNPDYKKYYFHTHNFTVQQTQDWCDSL